MPISQEVAYWSVVEQAKAIKEGNFTSRELLELTIERIESVNPELNAVVTTDLDLARKLADEADAKLKAGLVAGPLHGYPSQSKMRSRQPEYARLAEQPSFTTMCRTGMLRL